MNSLSITTRKSLMLFSGRAYPELAEEVGKYLDVSVTPQSAYDFANGEIFVRFQESVRGADAFVLQSHTAPINKWIMEQLIMIDALKRASAARITAAIPYLLMIGLLDLAIDFIILLCTIIHSAFSPLSNILFPE